MLKDLIVKARSVRSFSPEKRVSRDEIAKILDAARLVPSASNKQPLKYKIILDESQIRLLLQNVGIAGLIKEKLPPEGHLPSAFLAICHDEAISPLSDMAFVNVGISAQTVNLCASERGFASCMIGAFSREVISKLLELPSGLSPLLLMMIGVPDEFPKIVSSSDFSGDVKYFRNESGHFVPKRPLDEIIID